jgi:hypothetical protein
MNVSVLFFLEKKKEQSPCQSSEKKAFDVNKFAEHFFLNIK